MRIELNWPSPELSPNARLHWGAKGRAVKAYREQAFWVAYSAGLRAPYGDGEIKLSVTFHPPDKRPRDTDNLVASCKAAFDGLADAMKVNDTRFSFTINRADPVKGGKVVIEVGT